MELTTACIGAAYRSAVAAARADRSFGGLKRASRAAACVAGSRVVLRVRRDLGEGDVAVAFTNSRNWRLATTSASAKRLAGSFKAVLRWLIQRRSSLVCNFFSDMAQTA
jgi:hypothetical protein